MDNSKIIYLGLPYMNDDPNVMDFRADVSDLVAVDLAKKGHIVFAPISAWHNIAKIYDLPQDWAFWYSFDEEFIKHSGKLAIIMLYGWKISTGVTEEKELAIKYGLTIDYIDPKPYVEQLGLENNDIILTYGKTEYL